MDKKNKVIDSIADALGVDGEITPRQEVETYDAISDNIDNDYEYARGNMINTIEKNSEAIELMLDVAQQSQQARAYEVLATLMKNMADTNKDLLELSRKKKVLDQLNGKTGPEKVTNNLFVGSALELQKLINGDRLNSDEEEE